MRDCLETSSLNLSTLQFIGRTIDVLSVTSACHCAAKQLSQKGKESWDGWVEETRNKRSQEILQERQDYVDSLLLYCVMDPGGISIEADYNLLDFNLNSYCYLD